MLEYSGKKDQVQKIQFGPDRKDALLKYLEEEHRIIVQERDTMIKDWKEAVDQAQSRLKRTDAGPRDSKIDMSLTRERLNQSESRLVSPIVQADQIMVAKPNTPSPQSHDLSLQAEDVMKFILDRGETMMWASDWAEHFHVLPFGVIKTAFTYKETSYKRWEEIKDQPPGPEDPMGQGVTAAEQYMELKKEKGSKVTERQFEDGSVRYFIEVKDAKKEKAGVFPQPIPPQDFLFRDAPTLEESNLVEHRTWETKHTIKKLIKRGIYNRKDGDDLILEKLGEPTKKPEDLFGVNRKNSEEENIAHKYEILESYLEFACDKEDGDPVEIIVTWEPTQKIILRAIYNFHHNYCRPFVIHQFKHITGSLYGIPATFDLKYPHKAYSASINQRLDAASKAQEVAVLLPPNHPMLKQMDKRSVRGGLYENPGYRKEDIITFSVSEPSFSQLPNLEQIFEHRADRVMHLPPATWGEESADRPTATGTMAITEQSQFPQTLQLERFRDSFALVVKHMLSRYRQFYPEGMRLFLQQEDQMGQEMTSYWFNWPDGSIEDEVVLETKVSSSTMSKMIRKQEIVALLDRMPQLYQTMYQMAQMASDPMNPANMVAIKYLEGMRLTADMFFKEFEVPNKEQLNPQLAGGIYEQNMQQLQGMVGELQGQVQQMQQAGQALQNEVAQKDQELTALKSGLAGNPSVVPEMGGFA